MYGNYLDEAAKIVAEKRDANLKFEHARLTADEKEILLDGCLINYYAAHLNN